MRKDDGVMRMSAIGIITTASSLLLAVWGGWSLLAALNPEQGEAASGPSVNAERVLPVPTMVVTLGDVVPRIETFGRIASARVAILASEIAGRVASIAPGTREGAAVSAGKILLTLDQTALRSALSAARTLLAETEADAAVAAQAVSKAQADLSMAQAEHALRETIHARQRNLMQRGVASIATLDEAALALLAAEKAVMLRQHGVRAAELEVPRAALAVERARLAVEDASRALAATTLHAPFDGILARFDVVQGALVQAGEPIGEIIDAGSLEVSFILAQAEVDRLMAGSRVSPSSRVWVVPDMGRVPVPGAATGTTMSRHLPATLDRVAALAPDSGAGRRLIARLDGVNTGLLPGDFVGVVIEEPVLQHVAVLPETAITEDARVLVVGTGNRLREQHVRILRRQNESVVIDGLADGTRYVAVRRPHLGAGLLVEPYAVEDDSVRPSASDRNSG
jgi:RND family efflux transporter MFP subunit